MLEQRAFQARIAGSPGGAEGLLVGRLGFRETAHVGQDLRRLAKAGGLVAGLAELAVDCDASLRAGEGLGQAPQRTERIGLVTQRCRKVRFVSARFEALDGRLEGGQAPARLVGVYPDPAQIAVAQGALPHVASRGVDRHELRFEQLHRLPPFPFQEQPPGVLELARPSRGTGGRRRHLPLRPRRPATLLARAPHPLQVHANDVGQPTGLLEASAAERSRRRAPEVPLLPRHDGHSAGGVRSKQGFVRAACKPGVHRHPPRLRGVPIRHVLRPRRIGQRRVKHQERPIREQHPILLRPHERHRLQPGPRAPPLLRRPLRELQDHSLERPALEPRQIRQHRLHLRPQPVRRERERSAQAPVAILRRAGVREPVQPLAEVALHVGRRAGPEVRHHQLDRERVMVQRREQRVDGLALVPRPIARHPLVREDLLRQLQRVRLR